MAQLLIIIAASCAIGFGGGWTIKHWKDSGEIVHLRAISEVAKASNQQCETDIADVRKGVAEMIDAATDRAKKAEAAMLKAEDKAAKHAAAARAIREAPVRQDEPICDAVFREQMEYVQKRRDS